MAEQNSLLHSKVQRGSRIERAFLPTGRVSEPDHFWDVAANNLTLNSGTPLMGLLNHPPLGTAEYNRLGDSISCKSLNLKIDVWATRTAGVIANSVGGQYRICVIVDRQPNGAVPIDRGAFAVNSYLLTNATVLDPTLWQRNPTGNLRYVTLYDERFALGPSSAQATGTVSTVPNMRQHSIFLNLGGFPAQFTADSVAGDTIAFVTSNSLYVILYTGEETNTALPNYAPMSCDVLARLKFRG